MDKFEVRQLQEHPSAIHKKSGHVNRGSIMNSGSRDYL